MRFLLTISLALLIGSAHARQSNDIPGEVEGFVAALATAVRSARLETAQ